MADSIDVDTTQLRKLEFDLGKVPGKAVAAVHAATKTSAEKVAERMRADAEGSTLYPHFPKTISAGMRSFVGSTIEYEVGPDKNYGRQGALGNILYFGTSNNAPVLNINVGIDAEEPAWVARLQAAVAGSLDV